MVKMYKASNIFFIVGPSHPEKNNFPYVKKTEVLIWDDKNKRSINKIFIKKEILNLEIAFDNLFVVCESSIFVFNIKNFQLIDVIKTGPNRKGLIAVSYEQNNILVYPSDGEENGQLTIKNYDLKYYTYLKCHKKEIAFYTLSNDGLFLATASAEWEYIRIYEAKTGEYLDEIFREKENDNKIKCININMENDFISASCKQGFIHIWTLNESRKKLKKKITNNDIKNNKNKLSNKKKAFKQIELDKGTTYEIYKFGENNILYIITSIGEYFKVQFDLKSKEVSKIKNQLF